MKKNLVIILSETRASELTFSNFKSKVIDELNADLCICIGVKNDYDYNNPFYKLAKYKFIYKEPEDYGEAFDYAYEEISKDRHKYETLVNINNLYGMVKIPKKNSDNINYLGTNKNKINFTDTKYDEIVAHTNNFWKSKWKNQIYGIKKGSKKYKSEKNVITYKKPIHWREFLKIRNQYLGGIKDDHNQQKGSAGILIFFRWFLLKNLINSGLINKYDRFIITRSDFIYKLPHPKIELLNKKYIWIPHGENYGGFTDRHAILSKENIRYYLSILNSIVLKSNEYFMKMKKINYWNLEMLIKFHLKQSNVLHLVKYIPYVMYSVRNINGITRWKSGLFIKKYGYYIKYPTEYVRSNYFDEKFKKSGKKINNFYKDEIKKISHSHINDILFFIISYFKIYLLKYNINTNILKVYYFILFLILSIAILNIKNKH